MSDILGRREMNTANHLVPHYRAFRISYMSNKDGSSSVRIDDTRNRVIRKIPYNYNHRDFTETACNFLSALGIQLDGMAWIDRDNSYIVFTHNFETQLR